MKSSRELRSILRNLRHSPFANPDPLFKRNTRIRLLNQIVLEEKKVSKFSFNFLNLPQFFFRALPKYAVIVLILFFVIVPTTVLAAQKSLPSQPLYPLKRLSEEVVLAATPVKSWKTQVALGIANRRLEEYEVLKKEGKKELLPQVAKDYKKSIEGLKTIGNLNDEQIEKNLFIHKKTFEELRVNQKEKDQNGKKTELNQEQDINLDSLDSQAVQSNEKKDKPEIKDDNPAQQNQQSEKGQDKNRNSNKEKSPK